LFFLFLLEGWNVLFIVLYIICFCSKSALCYSACKITLFFYNGKDL
jgi:hypothetical protein